MATTERMSVSFDKGERQALTALTEDPELAEVLRDRAGRLRHRVPLARNFLSVEDLGESASDVVRAVVRIGLDAIARQYMVQQYRAALPAIDEALQDRGLSALFEASKESLELTAEPHAASEVHAVSRSGERSFFSAEVE